MIMNPVNLKKVRLQLKWYPNAAFAGVFVAKDKGFFAKEGIDVEIISGAPGINVEQLVINGFADLGISSLDSVMFHSQRGLPIFSIAQIFQGSSQGVVTLKSSGIDKIEKMAGKTIGSFGGVNQLQLIAFLNRFYLTNRVKLVNQKSIDQLLNKEVEVGSVALYNQLQPPYKEGLRPEDMNILMFKRAGVGMLEDTIVATRQFIKENPELTLRFVRALLKGWRYTYISPSQSVDTVMKFIPRGSSTKEHQSSILKSVHTFIKPENFKLCDIGGFQNSSVVNTAKILYQRELIQCPIEAVKVVNPTIVNLVLKDCTKQTKGQGLV